MATDVILDNNVTIVSNDVHLRREDRDDSSTSINFGNKFGLWHLSGPRPEPGSPLSIFWFNQKQWIGPMLSIAVDGVVRVGKRLIADVNGNVGVGTEQPKSLLHVHGQEIHASGSVGGYSFTDREVTGDTDDGQPGQRWVWYASGMKARLWSGFADKVVVSNDGSLTAGGIVIADGKIYVPGLNDGAKTPPVTETTPEAAVAVADLLDIKLSPSLRDLNLEPIQLSELESSLADVVANDLVRTIRSLRDRISSLEGDVARLMSASPAPVPQPPARSDEGILKAPLTPLQRAVLPSVTEPQRLVDDQKELASLSG